MITIYARFMVALALAIAIAALFLAMGTAQAMQTDISKTWCARQGAKITGDRRTYWGFIEKCHKRRGTKPVWYPACSSDAHPCESRDK
jgi:hypothetical protein